VDDEQPSTIAEEAEREAGGTLTVTFSRGQNMYGNDRYAYGFTTTDITKDWSTIGKYAPRFDKIIDAEIIKRTDIKNKMPHGKRGRPRKEPIAVPEETHAPAT
jgi:hypothetical protein